MYWLGQRRFGKLRPKCEMELRARRLAWLRFWRSLVWWQGPGCNGPLTPLESFLNRSSPGRTESLFHQRGGSHPLTVSATSGNANHQAAQSSKMSASAAVVGIPRTLRVDILVDFLALSVANARGRNCTEEKPIVYLTQKSSSSHWRWCCRGSLSRTSRLSTSAGDSGAVEELRFGGSAVQRRYCSKSLPPLS